MTIPEVEGKQVWHAFARGLQHNALPATFVLLAIMIIYAVRTFAVWSGMWTPTKEGFGVNRIHNLNTGGSNPQWWNGSADAGMGGSVGRSSTPTQVAAYHPAWRGHPRHRSRDIVAATPAQRSGFSGGESASHSSENSHGNHGSSEVPECDRDEVLRSYSDPNDPNGAMTYRCVGAGVVADMATCREDWDPAATAEAQSLAQVGSFQHDHYGNRRLQRAINGVFDSGAPGALTDSALSAAMAGGDTP